MLLQILWALERLATKITTVRLERHVDSDVRRDMVPLDDRNVTVCPATLEVQVVRAFATDMGLANVVLKSD